MTTQKLILSKVTAPHGLLRRTPLLAGMLVALGACGGEATSETQDELVGDVEQGVVTCVTVQNLAPQSTTVEDAYIATDATDPTKASTNYGNVTKLLSGYVGSEYRRALYKFDVLSAGIPAGSVVTSATLNLPMTQSPGKAVLDIYDVTAAWTESQVTWNQLAVAPNGGMGALVATAPTLGVPNNTTLSVPLPASYVEGWLNPGVVVNNGVIIDHPAAGRTTLGSGEAGLPQWRPSLQICYDPPTCSDGIQNQGETGVDCGGLVCAPCPGGQPTGTVSWTVNYSDPTWGSAVAMDAAGNTLLVGSIQAPQDFGGGTLTSPFGTGAYLVKLAPDGSHIVSSIIASNDPQGFSYGGIGVSAVHPLPSGGALVSLSSTVDTLIAGQLYLGNGSSDAYLLEVDAAGIVVSVHRFGGAGNDGITSLAVSPSGDIYLGMSGVGPIDFGGGPIDGPAPSDAFVVKLDASFQHVFSKVYGATGQSNGARVALDASGDLFVGYSGTGPNDFGGGPVGTSATGVSLARLTSSGAHVWSKLLGDGPYLTDLKTNALGDVFIGGAFYGGTFWGGPPVNVGGATFATAATLNTLLARYDGAGSHIYSLAFGLPDPLIKPHTNPPMNIASGPTIVPDDQGNVHIASRFQGDLNLGGGVWSVGYNQSGYGAKFDQNGVYLWGQMFLGDYNASIAGKGTGDLSLMFVDSFTGVNLYSIAP